MIKYTTYRPNCKNLPIVLTKINTLVCGMIWGQQNKSGLPMQTAFN
ncbi:hypothetical protein B0I21_103192 [Sphingobacterium paludis]|uniref:Uncharacterized protein n=1 Tax=Sphingobacterium paludis TaxID=1476465 RepID=A0A4R7D2Q0_9SPHI|nr:hypothetical protein B0I21_103192 [Sphingobacterium paludis]